MMARAIGLAAMGYERCQVRDLTEVVSSVCTHHHVALDELFSSRRYEPLPAARADLAVAFRALGFSLPEIGRLLGRDHTSVMVMLRRARPRDAVAEIKAAS
jgi:chromosomal replication initiation ATPase DnaA